MSLGREDGVGCSHPQVCEAPWEKQGTELLRVASAQLPRPPSNSSPLPPSLPSSSCLVSLTTASLLRTLPLSSSLSPLLCSSLSISPAFHPSSYSCCSPCPLQLYLLSPLAFVSIFVLNIALHSTYSMRRLHPTSLPSFSSFTSTSLTPLAPPLPLSPYLFF